MVQIGRFEPTIKIKVDHDFYLIQDAGHYFDEKETEKELFSETLSWFLK